MLGLIGIFTKYLYNCFTLPCLTMSFEFGCVPHSCVYFYQFKSSPQSPHDIRGYKSQGLVTKVKVRPTISTPTFGRSFQVSIVIGAQLVRIVLAYSNLKVLLERLFKIQQLD